MTAPVVVGLLDSGIDEALSAHVSAAASFVIMHDPEIAVRPARADGLGHGTALARIILAAAPEVRLANAQVFTAGFTTTPAAVASGLDWLMARGARIVNMSFGLRHDRTILRRSCAAAAEAGAILLAATPARGEAVFPAAYDGVVRISGDARCAPGEISLLGGRQADFGACPRPLDARADPRPRGGASYAVAHVAGLLAAYLAAQPTAGAARALNHLHAVARYHGPERRSAAAPEGR